MQKLLKDKIVFITGASSGIGAACAETFAAHGAKLLLCARREDKLMQIAKLLKEKYSTDVYTFLLDVRNPDAVKKELENLPDAWKTISVLINNAGLAAGLSKFQDCSWSDWEQMLDTNIKGLLYITSTVLKGMLARNEGHIINIGSTAGHEVYPNGNVYCATKYAVNVLTKALKMDLLGTPIRVSSVDPGMVETEFSIVRFKGDQARAKSVYADMTPLAPQDVADAVYYCASRPAHVNIREIVLMPTDQAGATLVHRHKK